jgi:hypothetical protein
MSEFTVVVADDIDDEYSGTSVPGEFRRLTDEPVEMWAVSRKLDRHDAVKLDDFWEASPDAMQQR